MVKYLHWSTLTCQIQENVPREVSISIIKCTKRSLHLQSLVELEYLGGSAQHGPWKCGVATKEGLFLQAQLLICWCCHVIIGAKFKGASTMGQRVGNYGDVAIGNRRTKKRKGGICTRWALKRMHPILITVSIEIQKQIFKEDASNSHNDEHPPRSYLSPVITKTKKYTSLAKKFKCIFMLII